MEINISDMVWAVLNFAIMTLLLTYFLYKPVLRVLDNRRNMLMEQQQQSTLALQNAEQEKTEARHKLATAHEEADSILAEAQKSGSLHKQYATEQAEQTAAELLAAARAEIAQEQEQAKLELAQQVAELSLELSRTLVGELADEEAHRRLVSAFFDGLAEDKLRQQVRQAADGGNVTLRYAHSMDERQKSQLQERLTELGVAAEPTYTHAPELLGGAALQIGDCLVDGSLRGRLERIQASVQPTRVSI